MLMVSQLSPIKHIWPGHFIDGWMTVSHSLHGDGTVIMNGRVQRNPVYAWKDFRLQRILDSEPLDEWTSD